jgi:hypothetical protein
MDIAVIVEAVDKWIKMGINALRIKSMAALSDTIPHIPSVA